MALASYNDMHNNVRNDALVIASVNALSSLFAGVTTSSILGYKVRSFSLSILKSVLTANKRSKIDHTFRENILPTDQLNR